MQGMRDVSSWVWTAEVGEAVGLTPCTKKGHWEIRDHEYWLGAGSVIDWWAGLCRDVQPSLELGMRNHSCC
jgi:hypothetical protein